MTATTYTNIPGAKPGASFGGWLSRIFWRIAAAREKQTRARIARHFQGQDSEHLTRLGYSPADIRRIRQI